MLRSKLAPCKTSAFLKAKYATIASTSSHDHWPHPIHSTTPPTPYQILNTTPSEPYSKARFTELVKIYHPDRCDHPAGHVCAHLPVSTRLERYRLIVAAHSILSNPERRRAYDRFGLGWAGNTAAQSSGPFARRTPDGAKQYPFSPHANATWEDWEYWNWQNQKRYKAGERPQPKFTSHTRFASAVAGLTVVAAFLQTTHIENITDKRRTILRENSYQAETYFQKRQETAKLRTRSGRIEEFVRQRDPAILEHEGLSGVVMDPDLCASFGVEGMDKELDMRKKFR